MEPLPTPSLFERIMATLPGWMLLLGGAAMVAMITLVPPWLECRRLDWQAQVMALQSQQLTGQEVAYEQFLTALREDDPVVVERMAYYHLRLKPVGTSTLDDLQQMQSTQAAVYNQFAGHVYGQAGGAGVTAQPLNKVWSTLPTIEDLLAKPLYRPSQYCPEGVVPDTRMVRLATGPARHLMLGFGVLCLFFGLLPASAGTVALARPVEDEYLDEYGEYDEEGASDEGQVAVLDETDESAQADELDDLFPDATTTAWALAGTGAVSISASGGLVDEEPVIEAMLDDDEEEEEEEEDESEEEADEDEEEDEEIEEELDLVHGELDEDEEARVM